ncbi:hypothetical protein [Primorskyibacter sedentarius]|uniref:hypothetical protein n=1 Tax=Primorskyibacter sedentarius TaxID=745311 RepID=UPI003EBEB41D
MAFIAPALAAIGGGSAWVGAANVAMTGYSLYSSNQQAKAQSATGAFNQELAEVEARQAEASALDRMRIRASQIRKDVGQQRVSYAASGVVVSEGSPLLAYAETVDNGVKDVQAINEQGRLDAWRARLGGTISNQQAQSLASSTRTEGLANLGTSLIGMFGKLGAGSSTTATSIK